MSNQLKEYRLKLAKLTLEEQKKRMKYLAKFHKGEMQGPMTGFASIDMPWSIKEKFNVDYLPNPDMTAYHFLYECNKDHLDDVALIYDPIIEEESTKITYGELFKMIDETAKAYIAMGVKTNDKVTVSLPSFVENIVNFFALNKIGAVANQIHPMVSQEELDYYLEEAKSTILVGYGDIYEKVKNIDPERFNRLKNVVLVSPKDAISNEVKLNIAAKMISKDVIGGLKEITKKDKIDKNSICISWKDFIKKGKNITDKQLAENTNYDGNLMAALTHTSGTTGKSKGVVTSSKAFNYSVVGILQETDVFKRGDKELLVLPPFPLYILNNAVFLSLCVGEQLIVVPKVDYEHLSIYFKKYDIQHVKGIPSTYESMMKDEGFDGVSLSGAKLFISGGGKFTCEDEFDEWAAAHGYKRKSANGWGMSEGGGAITCMFTDTIEKGTVGRPIFGCIATIINTDTGEEIRYTDEKAMAEAEKELQNEVALTGPSMMEEYYENPEETNKLFFDLGDGRKWIITGDCGKITKEGNVKLTGRLKRKTFIFVPETNAASKISNDYMETILCKIDGVEDAIVVAVPDDVSKQAFKAYISVRNEDYDKVISDLDKLCKVTFRKYISPIEYIVVNEIPKAKSGKNDYRYLEAYEANPEVRKEGKVKVLYNKKISER